MAEDFSIVIGTVGAGIWHSSNAGASWRRSRMSLPFHAEPGEIQVRALAVSPHDPSVLYAGSEAGIYVSRDRGATWSLLDSPMDGRQIWSLAVHPEDPDVIWAGTKPPAVYRTADGGATWQQVAIDVAESCLAGAPKVTNIVFDPRDPSSMWIGVEIDGVYHSANGGESWRRLPDLGAEPINQDVHGLAVIPNGRETTIRATTPDGIWTSRDEGQSWSLHAFPRFAERDRVSYCRGMAVKPGDPDVLFVGNGDFIPGKVGAIQRSVDGGETWEAARLPHPPNSTIYWFGTHPADPDVIVANSIFGNVYKSLDGGATWNQIEREFGEVRAIAWTPN